MQHDTFYRQVFSTKSAMQALIEGFVPLEAAAFDFDSLERLNAHHVSRRGARRESDLVWRVKVRDHWLYLYLLVEFQSTVDPFMAIRVMTYVGLLYESLIHQKFIQANHPIPPVLPMVIYNGNPVWRAATNVSDLIDQPAGRLNEFVPSVKYFLLDQGRLLDHPNRSIRNLAAAIFRAEHPRDLEEVFPTVAEIKSLVAGDATLTRILSHWTSLLYTQRDGYTERINRLWQSEGDHMGVREVIDQWYEQHDAKVASSRLAGIEEGRASGIEQGERRLILRLLRTRFGEASLTDEVSARIDAATLAELEHWSERLLTADSIAAVFG